MNRALCILSLCSLVAFSGAAGAAGNGRTLYKWVDDQGVTHYGDRIPPEYAGQEQHIINAQGIEINRLEEAADQLGRAAVKDLFDKEKDPIRLIKLKEIHEFLEQTTDYCEDVADALQNVQVKNN